MGASKVIYLLIALAGTVFSVIHWVRSYLGAKENAAISDANEVADEKHIKAMEAAEAAARADREGKFDAKATAATGADGAAHLLRDAVSPDDPKTN